MSAFEDRVRALEEEWLSPLAVRSYDTRGRAEPEEPCSVRTPFQRDRDRIVHSKPFRRLKGKTQVFIDPEGDHYRTRMTHTLETTAISRVVARALRLNEDLVEAIGLGHDMGHPPFGHAGEEALDEALHERFGRHFRHNEHSYAIAQRLNLTYEVCDGILTHTGDREPETLEGKIVRIVDRVAYINHDIDDAVRFGLLGEAISRARRSRCSGRQARSGSTRSSTISSTRRPRPETSSRARTWGRRCFRSASSCSSACTSGRTSRKSTSARATSSGGSSSIWSTAATRVDEAVDYLAGMTDRFALTYADSL